MNKKTIVIGIVSVAFLAMVGLGVYFLNNGNGNDFIDLEKGQELTCTMSDTQQSLLMAYVNGDKTYLAIMDPANDEVKGTCELPFDNNENIYMSQGASGELYVYNNANEVFKYNGNHFLKIPANLYTGDTNINFTVNGNKTVLAFQAGSVKIEKQFTYTSGYTLKNIYLYSNVKDMNALNLFKAEDPNKTVTESFIVLKMTQADTMYYAIYDAQTRELLRCIANPFSTTEDAFTAIFEVDNPFIVVGAQKYNINANEMTANETITPDPAAITIELSAYAEDNTSSAANIKNTQGGIETFIIQSAFTANTGLIVIK